MEVSDILEQLRLLGGVPWAIRAADEIARLRALLEGGEPVGYLIEHKSGGISERYNPVMATAKGWTNRPLFLHPSPPPPGWRLVKEEPTKEMLEAGDIAFENGYIYEMWEAMLAASPQPPSKA